MTRASCARSTAASSTPRRAPTSAGKLDSLGHEHRKGRCIVRDLASVLGPNLARLNTVREAALERKHPIAPARLDGRGQLSGPALANKRGHGVGHAEHLDDRDTSAATGPGQEGLHHHGPEAIGELGTNV